MVRSRREGRLLGIPLTHPLFHLLYASRLYLSYINSYAWYDNKSRRLDQQESACGLLISVFILAAKGISYGSRLVTWMMAIDMDWFNSCMGETYTFHQLCLVWPSSPHAGWSGPIIKLDSCILYRVFAVGGRAITKSSRILFNTRGAYEPIH